MHEVLRFDTWRPVIIENKRLELDDLVLQFTLAKSEEVKEKYREKAQENIKWLERITGITEYHAVAQLFFLPRRKAHKK